MAFDIKEYMANNTINLGTVTREVGSNVFKGGHNDIRKTNYDVKLTDDGNLDLYTLEKQTKEHKWR